MQTFQLIGVHDRQFVLVKKIRKEGGGGKYNGKTVKCRVARDEYAECFDKGTNTGVRKGKIRLFFKTDSAQAQG